MKRFLEGSPLDGLPAQHSLGPKSQPHVRGCFLITKEETMIARLKCFYCYDNIFVLCFFLGRGLAFNYLIIHLRHQKLMSRDRFSRTIGVSARASTGVIVNIMKIKAVRIFS